MTSAALAPEAHTVATRRAVSPGTYGIVAISIAVIAIMAAPIVLSALASIKTAADASAIPPHYLPRGLSFENYAKVFQFQAGLATYVANSALVAAMTIAACLALAAPAGYGLARFAMRGKEIAFLILLAPIMIPYQAILTPLYLDFAKVGLVNTHLGLAIVHTILQLPFSIFLMRASFEAIPREIEEAAVVDGCSTWQRLTRNLPASRGSRTGDGCAVRVHQFLERVSRRAHFHEPEHVVHCAHSAGERESGKIRRRRLGGAAGERHRLDHSLSRRLPRLAALLYFRPAFGRRQMNDRPSNGAPSGDGDLASGTRTIRDVARLAGVSIGTVSKALNANGRLSAETRAKVIKVAKAIDYRPNDLAQSLHRARSMTVGILSNDSFGRFAFPIVEALERRLSDHGIAVFMCNATDDPMRERRHIDQLLGKRVDGLVVTARRADRRAPIEPAARGLPVVYVFSQVENPDALCLLPDDEGGARLAVSHLAALGRKRIAHITGPERFEAVRLREMGWRKALAEAGLKADASDCSPRPMVRSLGTRGGADSVLAPAGHARRALLRQRPDRARRR